MGLDKAQFNELKELLTEQQRDLMLANKQSADYELSGLHKEILGQIKQIGDEVKDVKEKVDDHDITIKKIPAFFEDVQKFIERAEPAVKTFENLSWSGKGFMRIMIAIAVIAGGIVGLKEIIHNFIK